jgi:sRNA-binding carbon storage regulator CsrA
VQVTVVAIEQGAVTLGVTAPPEWKISRDTPESDGAASQDANPQSR